MRDNAANNFKDDRNIVLDALGDSPPPAPVYPANEIQLQHAADNTVIKNDELIRQFIAAAKENSATTEILTDERDIPQAVAAYLRRCKLASVTVCTPEWQHLAWATAGVSIQVRAAQDEDACGVSGIVAAAADCGAMLVDSAHPHQLTVSLLPPHHIAIVRAAALSPSLNDLLAIHADAPPHKIALLCGPSRTADIEQTLVLGVHGPLAVHVLVIT